MYPLFVLATGWILVGAADIKWAEKYHRYENVVVAEDTVFQSPARTAIHCAILCQQQDACQAYTFDAEVCYGHGVIKTASASGSSAPRRRLFVKESAGPCLNYAVLDDDRRDVSYGQVELCDTDLASGWYRFFLFGTDAVMPTQCVEERRCGTYAPYWLDLQGGELPALGQETATRACGVYGGDCCSPIHRKPLTVRNCGDFYVYKLEPMQSCHDGYCAQRINS